MTSTRYAVGVEYDGTHYHGWQKQKGASSVQTHLEQAISQVAAHPIATICAGRTDAGVHALHQVVHFDTTAVRSNHAWLLGINRYLPADITVKWIKAVPLDFHARFSATARRYGYVIQNTYMRSGVLRHTSTWIHRPLQIEAMRQAASYLVGKHDFSSFRAQECQAKTAERTVEHLNIIQHQSLLIIDIKANAFLHHMVRNIVGTLLMVGEGKQPASWVKEVLAAKDRRLAAMTTPPTGLHLIGVDYPPEFALPCMPEFIWFL
jgi:tRNA pseudouridine38-40 synthase